MRLLAFRKRLLRYENERRFDFAGLEFIIVGVRSMNRAYV